MINEGNPVGRNDKEGISTPIIEIPLERMKVFSYECKKEIITEIWGPIKVNNLGACYRAIHHSDQMVWTDHEPLLPPSVQISGDDMKFLLRGLVSEEQITESIANKKLDYLFKETYEKLMDNGYFPALSSYNRIHSSDIRSAIIGSVYKKMDSEKESGNGKIK